MKERRGGRRAILERRRRKQKFTQRVVIGTILVSGVVLTVWLCLGKKDAEEVPVWHSTDIRRPVPQDLPKPAEEIPETEILLINWENPAPSERPKDLVEQKEIFGDEVVLSHGSGSIDRETALAAKEMFRDALEQGVGKFVLNNAYRSVIYQEKLWQKRLAEEPQYGSRPYDDPVKVLPGSCSEHATGQALDILAEKHLNADEDYGNTTEGQWLAENAWKYGFILRYPKGKEHITGVVYEPWHYRYVGREAAEEIHKRGICLEEYLEKLPQQEEYIHERRNKTQAVVIDAGHGQPDDGTTGVGGTVEEVLNLLFAEKLQAELEARGYLVAMTRTDHAQLAETKDEDMAARRRMLTDTGQDISISIHQNYYEGDDSVSGPQVFYATGSVYWEKLAECIQQKLNETLLPAQPRRHTAEDFYIVRSGGAPCVLIECGFFSNAEEERKLNDAAYQDKLIKAIADGVDEYF